MSANNSSIAALYVYRNWLAGDSFNGASTVRRVDDLRDACFDAQRPASDAGSGHPWLTGCADACDVEVRSPGDGDPAQACVLGMDGPGRSGEDAADGDVVAMPVDSGAEDSAAAYGDSAETVALGLSAGGEPDREVEELGLSAGKVGRASQEALRGWRVAPQHRRAGSFAGQER